MKNYLKHKIRGKHPLQVIGMILFGIAATTGLAILFGFVIMWLWNWLMPDLFGLPEVTYWQGVGLFILMKILIGGCGGKSSKSHKHKGKCDDDRAASKKKDFSKWENYDKFWKEEGDKAYDAYLERMSSDSSESEPKIEESSNEKLEE